MATPAHVMDDLPPGIQGGEVENVVLVDGQGPITTIAGSDQAQQVASFLVGKRLLLVKGRQSFLFRHEPDLHQMSKLSRRHIELGVRDAGSGTHAPHVTSADG